ncbi:GNAT family N-acetyltransferase [Sphingobacterium suaedae]|uniref:GNAT family N-acetyltransferase n=1 Tax=Sphingobacterium suaedae TaxID=1686402 RepID=A0ABW5KDA5_9SPHI
MIRIRQATPFDSTALAPLMLLAMEEIIYYFIGQNNYQEAINFLAHHIAKPGNQYSYEYIIVAEEDDVVVGQICLYPGEMLEKLREPILTFLQSTYSRHLLLEQETKAGEVYIDTIAVSVNAQGKGIGKMMLLYAVDRFVKRDKKTLGLLVDKENPQAKTLYIQLGFKFVEDIHIFEKEMEHLQYAPLVLA